MARRVTVPVLALGLVAIATATTSAQTGVSGEVESVIALSLQDADSGQVRATASTTLPNTGLFVTSAGTDRKLASYATPVAGARVVIRNPARARVRTVTLAVQTP